MNSQSNEEFGEDKHKKKHVTALSWNLLSAVFFSSVMTTDMGDGLVILAIER
jgi:hypothetical protein